jgi:hypothetical protein
MNFEESDPSQAFSIEEMIAEGTNWFIEAEDMHSRRG